MLKSDTNTDTVYCAAYIAMHLTCTWHLSDIRL